MAANNKRFILLSAIFSASLFFAGIASAENPVIPMVPAANPIAGNYAVPQHISLFAAGSSSIRYTLDGTMPNCWSGFAYSGPVLVENDRIVRAISCYEGGIFSPVAEFTYKIKSSDNSMKPQVAGASTQRLSVPQMEAIVEQLKEQIKAIMEEISRQKTIY